jgi:hypothetical protein
MNIQHESLFDTAKVEKLYTEKDGVEVKYVCTTDLKTSDRPMDIFYRATPHPQFGNYYFGILRHNDQTMITNADVIESLEFGMIEVDGKYHYSQSHHDYKVGGDRMIDGGRQYIKSSGGAVAMRVKNGKFYVNNIEDIIDVYGETND